MQFLKALSCSLGLTLFISPLVYANTDLSIDEQNTIVKEELAAVQVMQEVCPAFIGKNAKFDQNMQSLIATYIKDYSDPSITLEKLALDAEYKALIKESRDALKESSPEENKLICEDVLTLEI